MSQQEPDLRFHICGILFAFSLLLDVEAITELCDAAKECHTRRCQSENCQESDSLKYSYK